MISVALFYIHNGATSLSLYDTQSTRWSLCYHNAKCAIIFMIFVTIEMQEKL